jgi:hypothetical protein
MNIVSIIVTALLAAAPASSAPPEPVPGHFPDVKAIKAWASGSWGGSAVDEFAFEKRKVVITRQQFTSGVESCRLAVFVQVSDGWKLGLRLRDVWGYGLKLKQAEDSVVITNSRTGGEVARISITWLSLQKEESGAK